MSNDEIERIRARVAAAATGLEYECPHLCSVGCDGDEAPESGR